MTFYVTVYQVDQWYGGPEEGGWYYEVGKVKFVEAYSTRELAESRARILRQQYPDGHHRYSVMPDGDDFKVEVSNTPGQNYPKERPHYE